MVVPDVQIRIGDLARETGETIHTLRFWTQEGLLDTVGETDKGYQLYSATIIARVNDITTQMRYYYAQNISLRRRWDSNP